MEIKFLRTLIATACFFSVNVCQTAVYGMTEDEWMTYQRQKNREINQCDQKSTKWDPARHAYFQCNANGVNPSDKCRWCKEKIRDIQDYNPQNPKNKK